MIADSYKRYRKFRLAKFIPVPGNEFINGLLHPRIAWETRLNKYAKLSLPGEIKSIGEIPFASRSARISRVPRYDLIAAHGKMSERIGETKRSGEMKTGTGKGEMREAGREEGGS